MPDTLMTRRSVAAGVERRAASSTSYDPAARTVEIRLATETPVLMPGWKIGIDQRQYYEILDCSPEACDLSQVRAGNAPLLDSHQRWSLADRLGVIDSARFEGRELIVVAALGQSQGARDLEAEIAAGTPPPASAGYAIQQLVLERFEGEIPVYRATKWTLREGTFTPIAADPNAGVRSDNGLTPCVIEEARAMPQPTTAGTPAATQTREQLLAGVADESIRAAIEAQWPATPSVIASPAPAPQADQSRAAPPVIDPATVANQPLTRADALQFSEQARSLGVDNDQIRALLAADTTTPAEAGRQILAAAAARQADATGRTAYGMSGRAGDERSGVRSAMIEGVRHNLAGTRRVEDVPEASRQYMDLTITETAMMVLGERQAPRSAADKIELFERAFHTTSDFGNIMGAGLNTRLGDVYQAAEPTYREIAEEMTFADFRVHEVIRPGDFPSLQKINEAGEIKYGTFGDKKEQAYVVPYGVQIPLSRQLLINDRWGEIDKVLNNYGMQVALFEETTFYDMKNLNGGLGPVLLEDGKTVYHVDHGNLTTPGTAISVDSLSVGRTAVRTIKNLSGKPMGLAPSRLLATPYNETDAEKAVAPVTVNDNAKANPFSGKISVITGGQLTGKAWELYPDRRFGTNWRWGLLDGFKAPRLKIEEQFSHQGVIAKLEHDFGCSAADFRYGYRNVGPN